MLGEIIEKWGGCSVSALEVYTDIFKLGEGYIQSYNNESNNHVANPLGYWKNADRTTGHYRVLFDDTFADTLQELQKADFAILNGLSYFGRKSTQDHASKMFAMIFDLDGVTDETLNNFLSGAFSKDWKIYPLPNYIALSGHGVHLYYVFENPIPLYPNIKMQLKNLKYALTDKMWNGYTSKQKAKQYQGINQGFRVIGGKTKIEGVRVTAYRINEHPYSLKQLCEYIPQELRIDETKLFKESKQTLEEARAKYPQWYKRVVENRNKQRKKWDIAEKVHGENPFALYDWWKGKIETGATLHHRYFSIMCLAIYGVKNGVPFDQVKKDAYNYLPLMNEIAPAEPFTKADCKSALECYDDRYATFPIGDIEKLSNIHIDRNKRNGRKQDEHLEEIRAIRDIRMKRQGRKWTDGNGRKKGSGTKQTIVEQWQQDHPNGRKADCIRETKLSKPTVYKYWVSE